MMKKLIIEVGANDGREINRLLAQYPEAKYYGFEPTIELYHRLMQGFGQNQRVNLIPSAISNFNGFATFNIAGQADWGCSSLFEFPENIHDIWPGRPDFNITHKYKVPVMKMSTFLDAYMDDDYIIEYAWIDAQGSDVDVLESFGDHIDKVLRGRVEVANQTELYKGTRNTVGVAVAFLESKGFKYNIYNDGFGGREVDVEFFRD